MPNSGVQDEDMKIHLDSPTKYKLVKPAFINNVKINTSKSSSYNATYSSIFTAKNSVNDPLAKKGQNELYDKFKKD
jgi:hypothetical protein